MKKKEEYNKANDIENRRLLDSHDLTIYIGMSKNLAREFCDNIGATKKFGKRVMYDRNIINDYLDQKAKDFQI